MKKILPQCFVFASTLLLLMPAVFTGCVTTGKYKAAPNLEELEVSFADASWNEKRIPEGQQCHRDNGQGATPKIIVGNIPAEANAIIMEFSDASVSKMDLGGHGKIGYRFSRKQARITIPSVPGHTFDLPDNFFLVAAHVNPDWDTAGAYLPPCSGGQGNQYYVTVKAVFDAPKGEPSKMLGKAKLIMGAY